METLRGANISLAAPGDGRHVKKLCSLPTNQMRRGGKAKRGWCRSRVESQSHAKRRTIQRSQTICWLGGRNLIAPDSRRGPNADDLPSCSMLRVSRASGLSHPSPGKYYGKRDWSGRSDLRSMGKVLDTGEPFGTLDQAYGQEFRLLAEGAAIRGDSVVSTKPKVPSTRKT
ncbi:predicted protein [Histoplasma capsulatum G186AR]|uniref:Uncharacterized protein n=1 Tax=Ajellomyces capsulatus (strain G186AR / H82 / ATCC MYA-2454 / RMSCC 2432) TaxID=447093 RepID=C0NH19_AJECG|nr:uncharacterized protein HCBG_02641 [Histoplasma capsulatum G186AR]EEH09104.1 predicted protein [Histoplasma capsulatum G186AR]